MVAQDYHPGKYKLCNMNYIIVSLKYGLILNKKNEKAMREKNLREERTADTRSIFL